MNYIVTKKFKRKLQDLFYVADVDEMIEDIVYQLNNDIAGKLNDNTYIPVIFDIPASIHVTSNYITNIRYAEM